jgi:hypothetical protein
MPRRGDHCGLRATGIRLCELAGIRTAVEVIAQWRRPGAAGVTGKGGRDRIVKICCMLVIFALRPPNGIGQRRLPR